MTYALGVLGIAHEDIGEYDRAVVLLEEAMELTSFSPGEIISPTLVGQLHTHRGVVAWGQGESDRAVQILTEALADQRSRHDPWGAANSLRYLAMIACERHDHLSRRPTAT